MQKDKDIDTEYEAGRISIIAALGKGRTLGKNGKLLWHLPDDMRRFKSLTMGHPVIMGRKTWDSLPEKFRPLPGRTNIVISRKVAYEPAGAAAVDSLEAAFAVSGGANGAKETFVIGGGEIYAAALPFADRLYLTLVDNESVGDAFFPPYENDFRVASEETGEGEPTHRFLVLERK